MRQHMEEHSSHRLHHKAAQLPQTAPQSCTAPTDCTTAPADRHHRRLWGLPVFFDDIHKVGIRFLTDVLEPQREEG